MRANLLPIRYKRLKRATFEQLALQERRRVGIDKHPDLEEEISANGPWVCTVNESVSSHNGRQLNEKNISLAIDLGVGT